MFMCFVNLSSVMNLDLLWKQVLSYKSLTTSATGYPTLQGSIRRRRPNVLRHGHPEGRRGGPGPFRVPHFGRS
jgi:hypothetical protein